MMNGIEPRVTTATPSLTVQSRRTRSSFVLFCPSVSKDVEYVCFNTCEVFSCDRTNSVRFIDEHSNSGFCLIVLHVYTLRQT